MTLVSGNRRCYAVCDSAKTGIIELHHIHMKSDQAFDGRTPIGSLYGLTIIFQVLVVDQYDLNLINLITTSRYSQCNIINFFLVPLAHCQKDRLLF